MPASMHYDDIRARLAGACSLRHDEAPATEPAMRATLVDVGERGERQGFEHFSLLFHAETASTPQQGTHVVTFDDGMRWEIFLVPIAREDARVVYEAVFNRTSSA